MENKKEISLYKSEKVKEIKKALEDNKTDHLPYIDGYKCKFMDCADILTLINELESENEEQYKRIMELEQDLVHADENVFFRECNVTLRENEIKEQALNKFAKKLKEKVHKRDYVQGYAEIGLCEEIDETLKEFLGEKND